MSIVEDVKQRLLNHPNWPEVTVISNASVVDMPSTIDYDHYERCEQIADLLDCHLLGDGSNRAVLYIDGYAVKIPIDVYGLKQNEKELHFWNNIPKAVQKYFVPCLGGGKTFTVFPIVKNRPSIFVREFDKKAREILTILNQHGIKTKDCEPEGNNWGLYNRDLVILDYGECEL